jgi:hypothetical protein
MIEFPFAGGEYRETFLVCQVVGLLPDFGVFWQRSELQKIFEN